MNDRLAAEQVTPDAIMQLGLGFWGSKTLLSAVELGLFTELAASPLDVATLTERLGLHRRSARDFLDALVALRMLDRDDGLYANTPAAHLFLDRRKPSYLGGMLEMAAWVALRHALGTETATIKPINVTIDYMRGGRERTTWAAGSVTRLGARIANVAATAWQDDRDRPIAAARLIGQMRKDQSSDDAMPGALVNKTLDTIFGLEKSLIGRVPMPFGVSLVAVLRRPS